MQKPRLLDQVRSVIRTRHYSRRTESAYASRVRQYILYDDKGFPLERGDDEVGKLLSYMAIERDVLKINIGRLGFRLRAAD